MDADAVIAAVMVVVFDDVTVTVADLVTFVVVLIDVDADVDVVSITFCNSLIGTIVFNSSLCLLFIKLS